MVIYLIFLTGLIIPSILIMINLGLFKKSINSREKFSPFECGFDPSILSRNSFSMKFYLIAVIFLIFDIEIALILPVPLLKYNSNPVYLNYLFIYFLTILIMGLFYEWNEGSLNWIN